MEDQGPKHSRPIPAIDAFGTDAAMTMISTTPSLVEVPNLSSVRMASAASVAWADRALRGWPLSQEHWCALMHPDKHHTRLLEVTEYMPA